MRACASASAPNGLLQLQIKAPGWLARFQLHIILNDQLVRSATEREKIVARYPHFALWTEDVDGTARRIEELGLVCRDVISGPTGLRQLFVKDPDGTMVEFLGPSTAAAARRMETPPAR